MWIDLEGLANLRDVGGIPTADGGRIAPGRLLRSDNLQTLTDRDIEELLRRGLTDVIDLRSDFEVENEGPGPLTQVPSVHIHQHSLFREWRAGVGEEKPDERPEVVPEEALPWIDLAPSVQTEHPVASHYLSYLSDRPDSVLAALREIGNAEGAALVHCAAGKDRTGVAVALLLRAAGVTRDAVAADFAATNDHRLALRDRLALQGALEPDTDPGRVGVEPAHLEAVLDLLDDDPRAPLRDAGVPEADLDAWQARLVS